MIALFTPIDVPESDAGIAFQVFGESSWIAYTVNAGRYETLPDLVAELSTTMGLDGFTITVEQTENLAGISVRISHALYVRLRAPENSLLARALGFSEGERETWSMIWASDAASPYGLSCRTIGETLTSGNRYMLGRATTLAGLQQNRVAGCRTIRSLAISGLDAARQQVLKNMWLDLARRQTPLFVTNENWQSQSPPHFIRMMQTYPDWRETGVFAPVRSFTEPHPPLADVELSLVEAT